MSEVGSASAPAASGGKKVSLPAEYKFDRYLLAFSLVISGVFVFLAAILGLADDDWGKYLVLNWIVSKPFFYVGFAFFGYHLLFRDKGPSGQLSPIDMLFRRIVSIMILVLVVVPAILYGFGTYGDGSEGLVKVAWLIEGISILLVGVLLWMIYWGSTAQGKFLPLPTAKGEAQLISGMQGLMRFLMSIFVLVWGVFGFLFNLTMVSGYDDIMAGDISGGIKSMGVLAGIFYLAFTVLLLLEMLNEEVEVMSTGDLDKLALAKKEAKAKASAEAAQQKAQEQAKRAAEEAKAAQAKAQQAAQQQQQ